MAYAGSLATTGPGFLLDYNAGAGWVHVSEVRDITGPSETTAEHDVTNQDSIGSFREMIAGLQDGGTVTFPMHSIPGSAGQVALDDLKHDRLTVDWRIVERDTGYNIVFAGFINQLGREFPFDGVMLRNVGIRVTGPVDEEAGS